MVPLRDGRASRQARRSRRGFGVHPALLDAAVQAMAVRDGGQGLRLPFTWREAALAASAPSALRVSIAPAGEDAVSLLVTDTAGTPVATVGSLAVREVAAAKLRAAAPVGDCLLRRTWTDLQISPAPPRRWAAVGDGHTVLAGALPCGRGAATLDELLEGGGALPDLIAVAPLCDGPDPARAAHRATARARP